MFTRITADIFLGLEAFGAGWILSPRQSWLLWKLSPLHFLCPEWVEVVILKLPAQYKKAGPGWWLRPIIPAIGGASLSYIVKLCLKNKKGRQG